MNNNEMIKTISFNHVIIITILRIFY